MHGLVCCAIQGFLQETYGARLWRDVRSGAGLAFESFEPMLRYKSEMAERLLASACARLDKPVAALLEDVGTWIVTHSSDGAVRRLLRFGGADFREFLLSLDELPGRIQMTIPDIDVPQFHLNELDGARVELVLSWNEVNLSAFILGAIRAISDDYGALVLMEARDVGALETIIQIELLDNSFAQARDFTIGGVPG